MKKLLIALLSISFINVSVAKETIKAEVVTHNMVGKLNSNFNVNSYHHIVITNDSQENKIYRYFFMLNYTTNQYSKGYTVEIQPHGVFSDGMRLNATVHLKSLGNFPIEADTIVVGQEIVHKKSKSNLHVI